jgi:DNA invertase Pin-like site-specific DNA recombinase
MMTTNEPVRSSGRTLFYSRWSTKKQTAGDSRTRQDAAALDWCARNGRSLDQSFNDAGMSAFRGKNVEQGELAKLIESLRPADTLLVENLDRLTRMPWKAALDLVEGIVSRGVTLVDMSSNTSISHETFLRDLGVIYPLVGNTTRASEESQRKSVTVRKSWTTKRAEIAEGKAIRQRLPGWLEHPGTGTSRDMSRVVIIEAKANIVRRIFSMALAGQSARQIAETLNSEGVAPVSAQEWRKVGKPGSWNGESLRSTILKNVAVMGDYRQANGDVVKGIFPAVISPEQFYAVQKLNSDRTKITTRLSATSQFLMTGLCKCQHCGGNLQHMSSHVHGRVYRYLVCSSNKAGQATNPRCRERIRYEPFEASFLAFLAIADPIRAALGQPVEQPGKLSELKGRYDAALKASEAYYKAFETVDASPKMLQKAAEADQRAEALLAEIQTAERMAAAAPAPAASYAQFPAAVAAMDRQQLKHCIRQFVQQIKLKDASNYSVTFTNGKRLDVSQ